MKHTLVGFTATPQPAAHLQPVWALEAARERNRALEAELREARAELARAQAEVAYYKTGLESRFRRALNARR